VVHQVGGEQASAGIRGALGRKTLNPFAAL